MASHGAGTSSKVAHVRPIQIQPTPEVEPEACQQESSSVAKDQFPGFHNIINITPIEEETQQYNTVTVNVNGVTKRVQVPVGRSDKGSTHAEQVSTSAGISVTLGPRDSVDGMTLTPEVLPPNKTVYKNNLVGGQNQMLMVTNDASKRQLPVNIMGASSIQTTGVTNTLTGAAAFANFGKGMSLVAPVLPQQASGVRPSMTVIKSSGAKPTVSTQSSVTNGIPGFLGSDGKFYIQVDPTKLQLSSTGGNMPSPSVTVAKTPAALLSTAIAQQTARQSDPSYSLNYLNKTRHIKNILGDQSRPNPLTSSSTTGKASVSSATPWIAGVSTTQSTGAVGGQASGVSGIRIESAYSLNVNAQADTPAITTIKPPHKDAITYHIITAPSTSNTASLSGLPSTDVVRFPITTTQATTVRSSIAVAPEVTQPQNPLANNTPAAPSQTSTSVSSTSTPASFVTATVTSSSSPPTSAVNRQSKRKQFLGVIDISDDESGDTGDTSTHGIDNNKQDISEAISQCKSGNKSYDIQTEASQLQHTSLPVIADNKQSVSGEVIHPKPLAVQPNQFASLISQIASGKFVLVSSKDVPVPTTSTQTITDPAQRVPAVKHPRNTARKSFGRLSRSSSIADRPVSPSDTKEETEHPAPNQDAKEALYDKIRKAHPELKDVRVHVEKLDLNLKIKTFHVRKLDAYLKYRRRMRNHPGTRKRNQVSKRERRPGKTVTVKTEPGIKVEEVDPTNVEMSSSHVNRTGSEANDDLTQASSMEGQGPVIIPIKKHRNRKRKKSQPDECVPAEKRVKIETTKMSEKKILPDGIHPKTKFLLIKTSQANFLMPVQPGVSPATVAQQISLKTAANVTVVSSATLTPMSTCSTAQVRRSSSTFGSTSVKTNTNIPPITVKTEPGIAETSTVQASAQPRMSLLKSIMFEVTKSQNDAAKSPPSDGFFSVLPPPPPGISILKPIPSLQPVGQSLIPTSSRPLAGSKEPTVEMDKSTNDEAEPTACNSLEASATGSLTPEPCSEEPKEPAKEAPGDRIRKLREMLKQQEAAVELARQQRERTTKFLEDMED